MHQNFLPQGSFEARHLPRGLHHCFHISTISVLLTRFFWIKTYKNIFAVKLGLYSRSY